MHLILYSYLILFFEFTFIRYIPAHVKATAYFANLTILAVFLGMGLGAILSRKKPLAWVLPAFPLLVYLLLLCVHFFSNCQVQPFTGQGEFFWPADGIHNVHVRVIGIFWVITLFFLLTTACFLPLGYGLGREFPKYRPLVAYSLDILGSILGIASFGLLSRCYVPPFLWILSGGFVFLFLVRRNRKILLWSLLMILLTTAMAYTEDGPRDITWSPYYKITKSHRAESGKPVFVNDAFHQNIVDMRREGPAHKPFFRDFVEDYHRPYRLIDSVGEVLILGAGTGNDVAVALMNGAKHVDAVEIDPVILSIGIQEHPNRPFQSDRVTYYNTDARVFLKNAKKKYDLIVYATLDSHTILAGQSNMRLDNYLYTLEAMQDIKRLLREEGVFLLQFLAQESSIATKLHQLVETTFRQPIQVLYYPEYRHFNHALLVGETAKESTPSDPSSPLIQGSYKVPTDNWPFLYLRKPFVPRYYIHILIMITAFAFLGIVSAVGKRLFQDIRPVMFFLGAAFLLLETKSITEFSLLFGSTWTVNLFVILGILVVILLANLLILYVPHFPRRVLFACLFASLVLCYLIPVKAFLQESPFLRDLITMIFTGLPILFAAGVFASCFQNEEESATALGWNLLGAVVGGLLEYSSMIFGIKALYLFAILLYAVAGGGILVRRSKIPGRGHPDAG